MHRNSVLCKCTYRTTIKNKNDERQFTCKDTHAYKLHMYIVIEGGKCTEKGSSVSHSVCIITWWFVVWRTCVHVRTSV